jgi:hypothetical protein
MRSLVVKPAGEPPAGSARDGLLARVDEGFIRADADLDWVRQLITSPVLAAAMTHRARVTRAQVEYTLDTMLRGVAP